MPLTPSSPIPSATNLWGDDIRVFRLKKLPFRLYYIAEEGTGAVCVYAIMHEKRRPDYWRHRVTG